MIFVKKIELTQNKYVLVDDEDFEELNLHKWCVINIKNTFYACRSLWIKTEKRRKMVYMHRFIMNCPDDKLIDHKDGNGLNNQKENLRICTRSQNGGNSKIRKDNTSGIKGVRFKKHSNKWVANIKINNKIKFLGSFTDINDAKKAYDKAAKKHFRQFYSEGIKNL